MDTEILAEALHFLYGGPEPWEATEDSKIRPLTADKAAWRIRAEQLKAFYLRIEARDHA
jgi:hypothetical protein